MNRAIPALLALTLLAGCATDQYGNSSGAAYAPAIGTLGGAGIAGAACSSIGAGTGQIIITAACAVAGGIAGLIGGQMYADSAAEKAALAQQRATATRLMTPVPWVDNESGSYGTVTATREGRDFNTGAYCREFQHKAKIAGRVQETFGKACQQPDGTWKIAG